MLPNGFKEEDVNKYIEYLNFVANHAKFDGVDTQKCVEYVKLLNYQQTIVLKKMQDSIIGEPKIHVPAEKPDTAAETTKKKTTRKAKS